MRFSCSRSPLKAPRHVTLILFFNFFLIVLAFMVFLPPAMKSGGISFISPRVMSSPISASSQRIITLLSNDEIYIDTQLVSLPQLKDFFHKMLKLSYDNNILVKVNKGVSVGSMARVVDLLKEIGFAKINIAAHE